MAQVTREVQTDEPVAETSTRREVVTDADSAPGSVVAARVVWYVAGVIIAFLALRLVLQILGANEGNPFVDFVYGVSGFFAAPFFGMFSYQPSYGVSYFEVSTLVAIIIYALAAWGIARLFTLGSRQTTTTV